LIQINVVSNLRRGYSLEQRIAQVLDQNRANLETALRDLEAEKAANLIWKGKRIFILGLRASGALSHYFGLYLSMIRPDVIILTSDNLLLESIRTATRKDVVVAFSFIRDLRKTIEAATYLGSAVAASSA
jgi:DNA-binding MurR/RpiR family transcriptional regulator